MLPADIDGFLHLRFYRGQRMITVKADEDKEPKGKSKWNLPCALSMAALALSKKHPTF